MDTLSSEAEEFHKTFLEKRNGNGRGKKSTKKKDLGSTILYLKNKTLPKPIMIAGQNFHSLGRKEESKGLVQLQVLFPVSSRTY